MYRVMSAMAVLCLAGCSGPPVAEPAAQAIGEKTGLTAGDREALRALDHSYARAWLKHGTAAQSEALLALFAPDAVIYPGGGGESLSGMDQLRAFWFPEGSSPTEVEYFEREPVAIEGSPALAAVAGRSRIAFTYAGKRSAQEGYYIIHARPDEAGHWKIVRMMWSNRPID
ncbi:YybH family protein [Qipengyuania mesophila]|uniref:YybH family protein n=1 Tax=Qipengyuania mesophila TaxID=2867246 RepID=UPI0035171745